MLRCKTGGGHKVGFPEDTLMSENEARARAGRLQKPNRATAPSAARTPPIGAKVQGTLRGILHGSKKESPNVSGDVKPDMKPPAKAVGDTLPRAAGGRDRVTDEILAAQMEILAENEDSDSGEDTVGADSEDDESFSGRGTHNLPYAPCYS
jgi:hypothetical protein